MRLFFVDIIRFFASILLSLGLISVPAVDFTPLENRVYTDGELIVEPDETKYIKAVAPDGGVDIYNPPESGDFGYRYGPSVLVNADGSIDIYLSAPGVNDEWDWIMYRHSPDGGKSWTEEKAVLMPTPDSKDFFSCCDPGVVKSGEYYYLAYTSTVVDGGIDNDVFVARSKTPDGPFEKWNGNGWGGKPEPIVEYDGDHTTYGAGEPSMVVLGDTLYIYYTWRDGEINETRVSTADASDENWPATMVSHGTAISYDAGSSDSADVAYVEDFGKFIAINTVDRFTEESSIGVYSSDDGLTFEKTYCLKTNISHCCHNAGISSRPDGHIRLTDKVYLAYAYGDNWGRWPTRFQRIELSLTDSPDFSDSSSENLKTPVETERAGWYVNYTAIVPKTRLYECSASDKSFNVKIYKIDTERNFTRVYKDVVFSNYDEEIISVNGTKITPVSVGETCVTAEWNGYTVEFLVKVNSL